MLVADVDGVVFVADSQRERREANLQSLERLLHLLTLQGIDFASIPYVLQLNKRDLPNVLSVDQMRKDLVRKGEPVIEANAEIGTGVLETFQALIDQLRVTFLHADCPDPNVL